MDPKASGMDHFSFYVKPKDLETAIAEVRDAEVMIMEMGSFAAGVPFAYIKDPN